VRGFNRLVGGTLIDLFSLDTRPHTCSASRDYCWVNELLRCFGITPRAWHWTIPVPVSHRETQNIQISAAEFEPTVPVFERFKVSLHFDGLYFKIFFKPYIFRVDNGNDLYRGADKSLARPGGKQPWKHVKDARDFSNIETRAVIKVFFFPARQGAEGNSRHSDRNISLFPSWSD